MTPKSIFLGTFNVNGSPLTTSDADKWLKANGAADADIVILSFQECGTCRADGGTHLNGASNGASAAAPRLDSYCRIMPGTEETDNEDFIRAIEGALSSQQELVADVAMGENDTHGEILVGNNQKVRWFGFIRLLVYAKADLADSLKKSATCIVCPVGRRKTSHVTKAPYGSKRSPDKGAICLFLPSLNLLIGSVHLAGTNRYCVSEDWFDDIRHAQLVEISRICENTIGSSTYERRQVILLGDLNFRIQIHSGCKDKERGGADFRAVSNIIHSNDTSRVCDLFHEYDRLCKYLANTTTTKQASIMNQIVDLFSKECFNKEDDESIIYPTFTFPLHMAHPRHYSDKRTPSWTDRILMSPSFFLLRKTKSPSMRMKHSFSMVLKSNLLEHVVML